MVRTTLNISSNGTDRERLPSAAPSVVTALLCCCLRISCARSHAHTPCYLPYPSAINICTCSPQWCITEYTCTAAQKHRASLPVCPIPPRSMTLGHSKKVKVMMAAEAQPLHPSRLWEICQAERQNRLS